MTDPIIGIMITGKGGTRAAGGALIRPIFRRQDWGWRSR
jgi:hypothetical protein